MGKENTTVLNAVRNFNIICLSNLKKSKKQQTIFGCSFSCHIFYGGRTCFDEIKFLSGVLSKGRRFAEKNNTIGKNTDLDFIKPKIDLLTGYRLYTDLIDNGAPVNLNY